MASLYDLKVECEECGTVDHPDPPENRLKWIIGMVIIFASIGGFIGLVVGVATAGVGFAAWIFTLPLGLYFGYRTGKFGAEYRDGPSCPE